MNLVAYAQSARVTRGQNYSKPTDWLRTDRQRQTDREGERRLNRD